MARAQIKYVVTDQRTGRVIQNARVFFYETGTTTPLTDLFAAPTGGSPLSGSYIDSNAQGEAEGYITDPRNVALEVTDNSGQAYYAGLSVITLTFPAFTEDPVPAYQDPDDAGGDDAALIAVANGLAAHIADTDDAHNAAAISVTPAGTIASTDVDAALQEVSGDIAAHLADASAAHNATAVAVTPSGTIASTDVDAALHEVAADAAAYADSAVNAAELTGATNLRTPSYNASGNTYPTTGGSGAAGAVAKGDFWFISVAGTLSGTPVVAGDQIVALADTPGQTAGNWQIVSHALGYVAENQANKSTNVALGTSDVSYPSQKAAKTYIDAHINDTTAAHAASSVGFAPAGSVAATDAQAAIIEVSGDIDGHLADTVDAHDASAISFSPTGTIAATDVQTAIAEVASDVAAAAQPTPMVLRNSMHLRRWHDVLANRAASQPVITIVGDSITAGAKAHNLSTPIATPAEMRTARYLGYAGIIRDRFYQAFGYGGEGFIFPTPYTIDSTYYEYRSANTGAGTPAHGGAGTLSYGPFTGITLTAGQQITFTTDQPCTHIDILWGFTSAPLTAAFTYTVDGGAPITATLTGSEVANEGYVTSISGLADTTHIVVINGPATKRADIGGIVCTRLTPGLAAPVVNGIGQSGSRISTATGGNFSGQPPPTTNLKKLKPTFRDTNTDLAIIVYGYNEAQSQDDVATFKATVQGVCDYVIGLGGCCLLVPDPRGNLTSQFMTYLDQYYTAMQQISDATDHVAYTDILPFWPDYATAVATGIIADTAVHPNSAGHELIGEGIYKLISGLGL